jgi:hypothetical protein
LDNRAAHNGATFSLVCVFARALTDNASQKKEDTFGTRLVNSFSFLSDKLLLVASSHPFYELEKDNPPPSLDVVALEGSIEVVHSFHFPSIDCDAAADGRVSLRDLLIRSDPVPTTISDPEHPYPFTLDPNHRLFAVSMLLEYESAYAYTLRTYHFLIPLTTIMNAIPRSFGGFSDEPFCSENVEWDDWGPSGARVGS